MSTIFNSFIKRPKNTTFDGEDSDEEILYVFRKHIATNSDWIFILILLLLTPLFAGGMFIYLKEVNQYVPPTQLIFILNVFWYLFTAGFTLHNFLIWFFNVYIISNKKIIDIDFHGLLYKNISEAPLRNVEDVTSNISGAVQTIFNYGDVYIQTSAEQREFEFENVGNPSKVRDIISDIVTKKKHGH